MRLPHEWDCPVCSPSGWTPRRVVTALVLLGFIPLAALIALIVMCVR